MKCLSVDPPSATLTGYGFSFYPRQQPATTAQADMREKRKTHRRLHLTPCEHLKVPCGSLSGFKGLTCLFVDPLSWCKPIEACRTMFQATCFCLILKMNAQMGTSRVSTHTYTVECESPFRCSICFHFISDC